MPTKLKLSQVNPIPASANNSALTGTPTAPTQATNDDSTKIATTAYVKDNLDNYLPLSGGELTGDLLFKDSNITRGTVPEALSAFHCLDFRDSNNRRIGLIGSAYLTDKSSNVVIDAYNTTVASGTSIGSIGIGCDSSGNVYTSAPTPATSDNSTQIATTAYVKSNLSDYLPLSGGTMTGAIILQTPTNRIFSLSNHGANDPNFTNIDFGWNYANRDGAGAAFRSADYTPSAGADAGTTRHSGAFAFYTRNATSTYNLTGLPSGTLTWEGSTFKIGSSCTLQYNSTNQCLDFIFT